MRYSHFFTALALFCLPLLTHADFEAPTSTVPTFENQQNLILTAQLASSSIPLLDQGTTSLPIGIPTSISYSIDHAALWPNRNAAPDVQDELFKETLNEQKLYIELWEGIPFTSSAHLVQNWDVTNAPTGQISATFPETGSYFLITYLPDAFYQDPQAECPNDDDWQTDCAPAYTLDQMRGYFNSSLIASDLFPYLPDAFGGVAFQVAAPSTPVGESNVLFLPGIEGSRLYMRNALGIEESVWEPSILASLSNLTLNDDGTSKHKIYTRDLVDYLYGIPALGDVYGPFVNFMNKLVADDTIKKWQAYPYDWRYDVRDIVANGTLTGNATGPITRVYLQDIVQNLASSSPTGKVTIIAHSNGGLLAKALAIELQSEGRGNLLDRIIFVGSPQFGTPETIGALLNGDGQTDGTGGLIMYGGTVRAVATTLPGMYGLLPSTAYFTHDLDAPILFALNAINNVYEKYFGPEINTSKDLENFVIDAGGVNENFPPDDLKTPQALSDSIFQKESATHSVLDAWAPPLGLAITAISGWGNLTPFQYTYTSSDAKTLNCFRTDPLTGTCAYSYQVHHTVKNTDSGDNTVVSTSALGTAPEGFYFNAKTFSADKLGVIGHGDLTSAPPIQQLIKNLLANTNSTIPYISTTLPSGGIHPLTVISVHSPVNITASDAEGNQTGVFPVPNHPDIYYEKQSIPGSSLQILDDEKYVYLPNDQAYTISLQGYSTGATTLDIGEVNSEGDSSTTEEFTNIPTTPETTAEFSLDVPSAPEASSSLPTTLNIDIFGDGSTTAIQVSSAASSSMSVASSTNTSKKKILGVLTRAATLFSVGDDLKKSFLAKLVKIESYSNILDAKGNILDLQKLVQKQIGSGLTTSQGLFLLLFLNTLQM